MWLIGELVLISSLVLDEPVVLGKETVTVSLEATSDASLSERLSTVARAPAENVVLLLRDVEAETPPQATWEVYVGPPDARRGAGSPHLVGVVSLYDRGPAEFVFVLDSAIAAGGAGNLSVSFVPASGVVVNGQPQAPDVRGEATIGEISLAIDSAQTKP